MAHHTRSGNLIPTCQPVQDAELAKSETTAMSATIVRLLPVDEQALLEAYIEGTSERDDVDAFCDALEVPNDATLPRLGIAVAQILLSHVQGTLPQWASVRCETVYLNRKEHKRHKDSRLAFNPQLVCTINWADSGPGFSWPESYHVTFLPGFNKFVITSSRDGPDAWGCADHAIGVANGNLSPIEAAKEVIIEFWRGQFQSWDQPRWAYLFDGGLIDEKTANVWADEVWCPLEEETDDDEHS
jgi:hypothetical protein